MQCDGYAAYKTIADDARTGDAITLEKTVLRYRKGRFGADRSRQIARKAKDEGCGVSGGSRPPASLSVPKWSGPVGFAA